MNYSLTAKLCSLFWRGRDCFINIFAHHEFLTLLYCQVLFCTKIFLPGSIYATFSRLWNFIMLVLLKILRLMLWQSDYNFFLICFKWLFLPARNFKTFSSWRKKVTIHSSFCLRKHFIIVFFPPAQYQCFSHRPTQGNLQRFL